MKRAPFVFSLVASAFTLAACNASSSSNVSTPKNIDDTIANITSQPLYAHSRWGIIVQDLSTGDKLIDRNSAQMFLPGSIMKVYSTASALKEYGPDYRFRTPVYATTTPRGGVVAGNLILVASGDFSFGLREQKDGTMAFNNFPEVDHNYGDSGLSGPTILKGSDPLAALNELAAQVRRRGITRVADVAIDDRLFDTYSGFNDGDMSSIWINENVVDITATPAQTAGRPAKIDWRPKIGPLRVDSNVTTVPTSDQAKPLAVSAGSDGTLHVSGAVAMGAKPSFMDWHISKPADFARIAFIEALKRAGVTVTAPASGSNNKQTLPRNYSSAIKVAEHVSPPLSEFVKVILKVSYNRGADDMVCLIAVKNGSRNCADGLKGELKIISSLGVSPDSTFLYDGGGTGAQIRTAPADETNFLRNIIGLRWGKFVHDGMAVMGVDGTQATNQVGTPVAGQIRVKDGTQLQVAPAGEMNLAAKTEVGYVNAKSGRQLVYGVFVNDVPVTVASQMMQTFHDVDQDLSKIAAAIQQGY